MQVFGHFFEKKAIYRVLSGTNVSKEKAHSHALFL
jgi:hypothetical protein